MGRLFLLTVILIPILTNGQGYSSEFKPGHSDDCHQAVIVFPRIKSLDSKDDSLKIDFILFNRDTSLIFPVTGLMVTKGFYPKNIFAGDSLVFRIENENGIDSISFPYIPDNFIEVSNKKDRPKTYNISKRGEYNFYFKTPLSCYGGHWYYDPRYGDKEYRWLFTKEGYYDPFLSIHYNEWVKEDCLEIFLKERRPIDKNSFKVLDPYGNNLDYELVIKRNPTWTILLNLSRDLKQFDKFVVLVSNTIIKGDKEHEFYFKYPMNVGLQGSIGMGGKYNNLEK